MGLDLSAYREAKIIKEVYYDIGSDCWRNSNDYTVVEYTEEIRANPHFPMRAPSIIDRALIEFLPNNGISCYVGSYSSYSSWRYEIAKLFNNHTKEMYWLDVKNAPFNELLNFSDCEGLIMGDYLNKIQQDFSKYFTLAESSLSSYDFEQYCKIKEIFDFAAPNGMVEFS